MGVFFDYEPIGEYIRMHEKQLMIKINDNGTYPLRRVIKDRPDYAQSSLRDRHSGAQGSKQLALQTFSISIFTTFPYVNMLSLSQDFLSLFLLFSFGVLSHCYHAESST